MISAASSGLVWSMQWRPSFAAYAARGRRARWRLADLPAIDGDPARAILPLNVSALHHESRDDAVQRRAGVSDLGRERGTIGQEAGAEAAEIGGGLKHVSLSIFWGTAVNGKTGRRREDTDLGSDLVVEFELYPASRLVCFISQHFFGRCLCLSPIWIR
jgi:hypothetical protein